MEEKSTPTSRAIAVIIIIITLIALSVIVPAKWLGVEPPKRTQPKLDLTNVSITKEVAIDTDNDGAISWKEIMTDTLKPTASTLEELKKIPIDQKEIDILNDPNNLTASFAKNLYLTGAYFEKNGITDEASKEQAMTSLMQAEKAKITPTTFVYKDLNVAKTESKTSIKEYGNKVASILGEITSEKTLKADVYAIATYTESKDVTALKDLVENSARMELVMKKVLALSVPPSATIYHLLLLNKLAAYGDVVKALSTADSDPLRSTFVVTDYPIIVRELIQQYDIFAKYFSSKNVTFSSKEPGYVFVTGYTLK